MVLKKGFFMSKNTKNCSYDKVPMSKTRKRYMLRLVGRIFVFVGCIALYFIHPESFHVLEGSNFFKEFSILHVLWLIWILDMICQLIPLKDKMPLGSQKLFREHFRPIREKINYEALREYVITTTKSAYKIFLLWVLLLTVMRIAALPWMSRAT